MSQLFLFTGANAYALHRERQKWTHEFQSRHGPENLLLLEAQGLTFCQLLDEVGAAPFIAAKRLVLVDGVPRFSKEEVAQLPTILHKDCILVFSDPAPDKRLAGLKELMKIATVKEFVPLRGKALTDWLQSEARALGADLSPPVAAELCAVVGNDQGMLAQELGKLSLYSGARAITREDIDAVCVPSGEQEVWYLLHLLSDGKVTDALAYVGRLLAQGDDPFSLWNLLLWMLKNFVLVAAALREGESNPARIAASCRVPFPSACVLLSSARNVPLARLRSFVGRVTETDIALKTGGYRATADAPQELIGLIDRFVLDFAAISTHSQSF